MKKLLYLFLILAMLPVPASALELTAPEVPYEARENMPGDTENFRNGLEELISKGFKYLRPDLLEASRISLSLVAAVMLVSVLKTFEGPVGKSAELAGTAAAAGCLLLPSNAMIQLGARTVVEISEYGKLLLPVMTGALAAQGGITKSTALFAGTAGFTAALGALISRFLIPGLYLYLSLAVGGSALGENTLKKLRDLVKSLISWALKTVLTAFTSYIGLTGVISGTTDAAALKATKATVSTVVPVVGNILSGASETILLSAAVLKNAAGIYGILAMLAIFLEPFVKILAHYWILKLTAALCSVLGGGPLSDLIGDFSTAMGFLLAMTGTTCLLMLIGTVCFMKGVSSDEKI